MDTTTHMFELKSGQLTKDNDTSIPGVFPVKGYSYEFRIMPKLKAWRFGLRFISDTRKYYTDGAFARYKDTNVRHIEVCAARFQQSGWNSEQHLELVNYLPSVRENPLYQTDAYTPLSQVTLKLTWIVGSTISIEVTAEGGVLHTEVFDLGGQDHFRIFAWAEMTPYNVTCEIMQETVAIPMDLGNYGPMASSSLTLPIKDLAILFGRNNSGKSTILTAMCQSLLFADETPVDYIGLNRNYSITAYNFANDGHADAKSIRKRNRELRVQRTPGMHQNFDWVEELSLTDDNVRASTITWMKEHFEEWVLEEQKPGKHTIGYKMLANGQDPVTQGNGAKSVIPIIMQLYSRDITLLAIDEPEFGLEARMQKILFRAIQEASEGLNGFPQKRIVLSTHSHLFLDRMNPQNNFKVTKEDGKMDIHQLATQQDLEDATYQLLGNTPADLFYPANIIIVEGVTDQCFLMAVYRKMLEAGQVKTLNIAVHTLDGIDNAKTGTIAIDQIFSTLSYTPVYRNKICAMFDLPDNQKRRNRIEKAFDKTGSEYPERLLLLDKGAIEYFYPLPTINRIFGLQLDAAAYETAVTEFLKTAKNHPNKRGKFASQSITKKDLASLVVNELTADDLPDINSGIAGLIVLACERGFQ